jgi:hypothetical protein
MSIPRDTLALRAKSDAPFYNMPLYDVYVTCDQCGQPHSVHVQLTLDDTGLNKARLSDIYSGGAVPSAVAFMQTNKYRCPHTKQLFPANDIEKAMLIAA